MGNLCTGDKDEGVGGFQEGNQEDEMEDWGKERAQTPSDTVAYNINSLPKKYKEEGRLSKLQELINNMKANERKGKKILAITRIHGQGEQLEDPYLIRADYSLYIGEWKYNAEICSTVPGGLGRLYKEDQIIEGEILTYLEDSQKNRGDFREDLAEKMIRETKRRAKFFNKDKQFYDGGQASDLIRKLKIVLDGQGRAFSRTMEQSGDFQKGKLNGKGQVTIKYDKDIYNYKGQFIDGKKNGKGVQTFKNTIYDGQFNDDLKEGKGMLTLFISHKFEKEVEEQNNKLAQDSADRNPAELIKCIEEFLKLKKEKFVEPFQDAIKELNWKGLQNRKMKGLLFLEDPNFLYQHIRKSKYSEHYKGQFIDNQFEGFGKYTWFNGKCYEGTWKKGKMDGFGQFFWQKGVQYYRGEYKDDMKHGKGEIHWSLTKMYRGDWAFGQRHGYGQLIQVNQLDEDEVSAKEQVNQNLLGNLFSTTQKKKKAQIKVIGGVFQKDKLTRTYFEKEYQFQCDIDLIRKEQNKMVCFVKGIRYEEEEDKQ